MRLFLISDNNDTAVGMRLAGVDGKIVDSAEKVADSLKDISKDGEIGIILINDSLAVKCKSVVAQFRKEHTIPIVVEIPDRNSDGAGNPISEYVRDAIGMTV